LGSRIFPELIQKNCNAKSILSASKNINNMQSISGQLRELLVGNKEEDYIKQILEL
jgi:lipid A disaccharide synthetase